MAANLRTASPRPGGNPPTAASRGTGARLSPGAGPEASTWGQPRPEYGQPGYGQAYAPQGGAPFAPHGPYGPRPKKSPVPWIIGGLVLL